MNFLLIAGIIFLAIILSITMGWMHPIMDIPNDGSAIETSVQLLS